jgi:aspartate/methionine/tyrosine aminotransferase
MARILNRYPRNDIISLTEAAPLYDLAESVGPDLHLRDLLNEGRLEELADLPLAYGPAGGRLELRAAIATSHGVDAGDVIVTVGGMQAIFLTASVMCGPGDEAVTTLPSFPNTLGAIGASGAELKTLKLGFETGYRLNRDELAPLLSPKTRLVCLTSPQNPSGVEFTRTAVSQVLSLMDRICPEAVLLFDETYREAAYRGNTVTPSAATLSPRIVATGSLSKCHGAPGLRIGWAIARDAALREQLLFGKFNTSICSSAIDEALALRVLERRDALLYARRDYLGSGLAQVTEWVEANGAFVDWVRPNAGALCCVRLKPSAFDETGVARFYEAIGKDGVRVAPGSWFGEDSRIFRLGFGLLPMGELEAALAIMTRALRSARREAA